MVHVLHGLTVAVAQLNCWCFRNLAKDLSVRNELLWKTWDFYYLSVPVRIYEPQKMVSVDFLRLGWMMRRHDCQNTQGLNKQRKKRVAVTTKSLSHRCRRHVSSFFDWMGFGKAWVSRIFLMVSQGRLPMDYFSAHHGSKITKKIALMKRAVEPRSLTFLPLKNGGETNRNLRISRGLFSGPMLVLGRVTKVMGIFQGTAPQSPPPSPPGNCRPY